MRPLATSTAGYTLFEMLVVIAIIGILFGIVAINVNGLHNNADTAASTVTSSLIQARTTAISTTSSIRVTLSSPTVLLFETNTGCSKTTGWTSLSGISPSFNPGVSVTPGTTLAGNWSICFTNRGELLLPAPATLTVKDTEKHSRSLTVYLTGSVSQ